MRIALLVDPLDTQSAGIHKYVKGLVQAIAQHHSTRHDWILVRPKQGNEILPTQVIPIYPFLPLHQRIRQFWDIPQFLKKWQADIVVEFAHFGPFRLPKPVKRVTFIHDLTPILFPSFHPRYSSLLHQWFLEPILQRADLILANSEHTQADLLQYQMNLKAKTKVLYPGVSNHIKSMVDPPTLEKYGIKAGYFLHVGTIEPRKNITGLLTAFEAYCREQPNDPLIFAGSPGWRAEAIERAFEDFPFPNRIKRLGFVPEVDLPALYSHAKALVFPSLYEGFGLPVLEAMACKCPVITSRSSSLPEAGGEAALYVNPLISSQITQQMLAVREEALRQRMIQSGSQQVASFTWKKTVHRFVEYLEDLESEGTPSS